MDLLSLTLGMVELLGSPDFSTRSSAARVLAAFDSLSLPSLLWAADHHRDLEVRRAAGMLREDYASVWPSAGGPVPWVDMLPAQYPERQRVMDRWLSTVRGAGGDWVAAGEWPDYRIATAAMVADLRRRGWTRPEVRLLLDAMVDNERAWREKRR